MARLRRRLLAVVAAAGLFVAGAAIGRATARAHPNRAPEEDRATASGDTSAGEAAPPLGQAGIEGRYPHTPTGAVMAATAFAMALDGPSLLDPQSRAATLTLVAASGERVKLADRFDRLSQLIATRLDLRPDVATDSGFVWRAVPAGWQLRHYTDTDAVVAIWGTGVMAIEGRQLDQPGWQTTEVTLRWERDNWRLVGFRTQDGPTPPTVGSQAVGVVGRRINEFRGFHYLPSEAEGR